MKSFSVKIAMAYLSRSENIRIFECLNNDFVCSASSANQFNHLFL